MRERNGVSASGFTSVAGIMLARIYCMPHPNCASSIALAVALALAASPCGAVTVSAPYLVKDIIPEDSEGYQLTHMTGVGDTLFFVTGGKEKVLWKSDGTAAGTVPVADVAGNWEFQDPTSFGDILVFEGPGGLWRSDGTKIGTHFIATVWPYGEDRWESPPMIVREGTLFVAGCGPNRTCGLWRSDGTPEGTMLVQQGFGSEIAPFRGGLIGSSAFWTSDGTAEGARRISLSYLEAVRAAGEDLAIFTRSTRYSSTREYIHLWRTDGTDAGTFPIATLEDRFIYDEDPYRGYQFPTVLPSAAGDGRFVVCTYGGGMWSSDGTAEGTRMLAGPGCDEQTVKQKVGGVWLFDAGSSLWRSDGTPEGTRSLGPFGGGHVEAVLGGTNEVVVFAVNTRDGGTELWRSDGTAAGTFAVSPMPTVGWWENSDDEERPATGMAGDTAFFCGCTGQSKWSKWCTADDLNGCDLWAVTISSPSTTTTSTTSSTTTSTTLPRHPEGVILADVSVLKEASRHRFGDDELLWADRKSPKQTFIRTQVTGLGDEPARAATLRLHVAETRDAPSKAAGRIHLMDDCTWDERRMTWQRRPVIDTDPLDTQGRVKRGQAVDFDVTEAIVGDGVYCFAIDSRSSDGAEYHSREAGAGGPELLISPPDPSARVGVVEADASVHETQPDRNFGTGTVLQVDGKSVKRTFFRVRVRGFNAEPVRDARLRLQVDDKHSARGPSGRLHQISDCSWNERTVTYKTQPAIDGPLLDELGEVEWRNVIEFDVTEAITGDGTYCFALESSSPDGVMYRSREAAVGGPVIVMTSEASVTSRVSPGSSPALSADGRFVTFLGRHPSYPQNRFAQILVHDRQAGTTDQVSVNSFGTAGNGHNERPVISADGRSVAFYSEATNLVPDDTNGKGDVFVHDRHARTTERVSVDSFGAGGNAESGELSLAISADGRFVVFVSNASNLVANDTNNLSDVFVHDRHQRTTERVSAGLLDGYSHGFRGVAISGDGRIVAFGARASACWTCKPFADVFVNDRQQQTTELVSVYPDGSPIIGEDVEELQGAWYPALSADGQIVVFGTSLGFVFVHDRRTGLSQPTNLPSGDEAPAFEPHAVSADGRFVVSCVSGNNIYVHDLLTGRTEALVDGIAPSISHDGRLIAFQSGAVYLFPDDTYNTQDVFVRAR